MALLRSMGLAAVAAAGLSALPASASVILTFTQSAASLDSPLRFGGTITVSDAAYASGLNLEFFTPDGNSGPSLAERGLEAIDLRFESPDLNATFTPETLAGGTAFPRLSTDPGTPFSSDGFLASIAGQGPFGYLGASEEGFYSLNILFSGGTFGVALTTTEGVCATAICAIDGSLTSSAPPTAVPEPASLSLLAVGAVGLLAAGTRRLRPA